MNLKNVEGSFRTKPNGTIEYRTYIDGKQKSFYGKSEAECLKKCLQIRKARHMPSEHHYLQNPCYFL